MLKMQLLSLCKLLELPHSLTLPKKVWFCSYANTSTIQVVSHLFTTASIPWSSDTCRRQSTVYSNYIMTGLVHIPDISPVNNSMCMY